MNKTIALIIPRLCNGGAEKVAADMSIFLCDAGYRVIFLLDMFDRNNFYPHKGEKVIVEADPFWNNGCKAYQLYRYFKRAKKYKECKIRYRVDISISFMLEENLTNVMSDIGDKKILTIHSMTSYMYEFKGQLFADWKVIRRVYPRADAVIGVSRAVKRDLENEIGIRKNNIGVIYNAVNLSVIREMGKEPIQKELSNNLILYVGRLDDEKRPWIAVRVMKKVVAEIPDAQLVMLGNGENINLLNKLIKYFGLEKNVQLAGFHQNVAKYMTKAKVLVLCSRTEAFPSVLIEALACGLPVVANNCAGGVCEIISYGEKISNSGNVMTKCGVITPMVSVEKSECSKSRLSREEKLFAQAVCLFLNDEKLRKRVSENALKRSLRFSQERIMAQWLELLRQ